VALRWVGGVLAVAWRRSPRNAGSPRLGVAVLRNRRGHSSVSRRRYTVQLRARHAARTLGGASICDAARHPSRCSSRAVSPPDKKATLARSMAIDSAERRVHIAGEEGGSSRTLDLCDLPVPIFAIVLRRESAERLRGERPCGERPSTVRKWTPSSASALDGLRLTGHLISVVLFSS
jgi:hypothetical protein